MSVTFGPVGGPYNLLGVYADSTAWGYYTVYLTVPNMGNYYSLRFNSIFAALGLPSVGNFLDDVSVCLSSVDVNENLTEKIFSIFPNPFSHALNFILPESAVGPVKISIIDLHAKTIYESKPHVSESGIINMEVPGLTNGIYLLKAESAGEVYHQKIVRLE